MPAQNEHAARALPFDKQDCPGRQNTLVADLIQRLQRGKGELAKEAGFGVSALSTVVDDVEPIGRLHACLPGG